MQNNEKRSRVFVCGTFGAGKTTIVNKVHELLGAKGFIGNYFFAEDYARSMFKSMDKKADDLTESEKGAFHHGLMIAYMSAAINAQKANKILISDGGPAEVMAYGDMEGKYHEPKCLLDTSLVFLVGYKDKELEIDGLRHTDEKYREFIDKRITEILLNTDAIVFQVPTGTVEDNAELIVKAILRHTKLPNETK